MKKIIFSIIELKRLMKMIQTNNIENPPYEMIKDKYRRHTTVTYTCLSHIKKTEKRFILPLFLPLFGKTNVISEKRNDKRKN